MSNKITSARVKRRRCSGVSLIELMISIGIMSVIIAGAFQIINEGLQLYRTNNRAADAQVSVLKVLSRITTEAVNARPDLIKPNQPADRPGIVFATPFDSTGKPRFNEFGQIYWQRYVCFYFESVEGKIYRGEVDIPPENTGGPGDTRIQTVVKPGFDAKSTDWFATDATVRRRVIADDIADLVVEQYLGSVGAAGVATSDAYDIRISAGDEDDFGPSGYFIEIDSRVSPRG